KIEIRKKLGIPLDAKLIGIFGNHSLRKRTHVLADVIAALKDTGDVFGIACGKRAEPYDHLLDQKIEAYGLERRLFKPGFITPVANWIAGCDLILAPAVREPFGRSFLEAASAGTPLIMSSDSGAAELIEHERSGVLVEPEDLNGWIQQSSRILRDKNFAESLIMAARSSLEKFNAPSHAARIKYIYEELLR
ncbi:MAG: glycosyltransferase family 4 protein, partial [Novosphingobium sp.]